MFRLFNKLLYSRQQNFKLNRATLQCSDKKIMKHYDDFRLLNYKDLALPTTVLASLYFMIRVVALLVSKVDYW